MLRSRARVFIRHHVTTYLPYLRLMGYFDAEQLPNHQTDIHIGGYPRSANSFCTILMRRMDPDLRIAHHVHTVVTLKLARKFRVPSIILVRNPDDAISSNIVRMGEGRDVKAYHVANALGDYITYYDYLERHRAEFTILEFKDVIADPTYLFRAAADLGVISMPSEREIADLERQAVEQLRADGRKPEMRNLPNEQKEERKRAVRTILDGRKEMARARLLYRNLSPHSTAG